MQFPLKLVTDATCLASKVGNKDSKEKSARCLFFVVIKLLISTVEDQQNRPISRTEAKLLSDPNLQHLQRSRVKKTHKGLEKSPRFLKKTLMCCLSQHPDLSPIKIVTLETTFWRAYQTTNTLAV